MCIDRSISVLFVLFSEMLLLFIYFFLSKSMVVILCDKNIPHGLLRNPLWMQILSYQSFFFNQVPHHRFLLQGRPAQEWQSPIAFTAVQWNRLDVTVIYRGFCLYTVLLEPPDAA